MMPKYRCRSVVVDAEPYQAGHEDEWAHQWHGALIGRYPTKDAADRCPHKTGPGFFGATVAVVATPSGRAAVEAGDWIVTDAQGGRFVVKADRFEAAYEPIGAEPKTSAKTHRRPSSLCKGAAASDANDDACASA